MHFPIVALVGKYHDTGIAGPLRALARMLQASGREVLFEAETAVNIGLTDYPAATVDEIGQRASLAIVMGGDGTMLGLARQLAPWNVPLVGINHGRLGFITDIPLESAEEAIAGMMEGNFESEERILLDSSVIRGETTMISALALNDVVLSRAGLGGMIEVTVQVDGLYMSKQRADGLIIATPTGSTAYALSVGGPMMHPSIPAWVMAPIAPHTFSNRPIVLSDATEVAIEVVGGRDVSANFDMQSLASLMHGDRILVTKAEHSVRFLHPKGWNYFATLRKKLGWNEGGV